MNLSKIKILAHGFTFNFEDKMQLKKQLIAINDKANFVIAKKLNRKNKQKCRTLPKINQNNVSPSKKQLLLDKQFMNGKQIINNYKLQLKSLEKKIIKSTQRQQIINQIHFVSQQIAKTNYQIISLKKENNSVAKQLNQTIQPYFNPLINLQLQLKQTEVKLLFLKNESQRVEKQIQDLKNKPFQKKYFRPSYKHRIEQFQNQKHNQQQYNEQQNIEYTSLQIQFASDCIEDKAQKQLKREMRKKKYFLEVLKRSLQSFNLKKMLIYKGKQKLYSLEQKSKKQLEQVEQELAQSIQKAKEELRCLHISYSFHCEQKYLETTDWLDDYLSRDAKQNE